MKGMLAKSVSQKTYGFARLRTRERPIYAGFPQAARSMAIWPKGRQFRLVSRLWVFACTRLSIIAASVVGG